MTLSIEEKWIIGGALLVAACLFATAALAQFADVYGDPYGNVVGDVYLKSTPSPSVIVPPRPGATSPSVQLGREGMTMTWPGQDGGPAVIQPPGGVGQDYLYSNGKGMPDVLLDRHGNLTYIYPGK